MLDKLAQWFRPAEPAPQIRRPLAMAVLLAETARADFDDQAVERATIRDVLVRGLSLTPEEATQLIDEGFAESRDAVSLHGFLDTLNAELDPEGKRELLQWLWRVAYADGRLDPQEEARIRQLADLLFMSHADFVRTRLLVQQELGIG